MQRFLKLDPGEAVISVITFGELLRGREKRASVRGLERLRELVHLLPAMPLPENAGKTLKIAPT